MHAPTRARLRLAILVIAGAGHVAHAGTLNLLVSSRFSDTVNEYRGDTGAFVRVFADGGGMDNPNGIGIGADGDLFVAMGDNNVVSRYDGRTGDFIGVFVDVDGGIVSPRGLIFGPDGNMYVASGGSDQVICFDRTTGARLRVAAEGDGLDGPLDMAFDPAGDLYVSGGISGAVHKYDGVTGASLGVFATDPQLTNASGLRFGPDGNLYVASGVASAVFRFDGTTGEFIDVFASGNGLSLAIGITFHDGLLYVASFGGDSVLRFDDTSGAFFDTFVQSGDGGLNGTHWFAFVEPPKPATFLPSGFAVGRGTLESGGLPELAESDDERVVVAQRGPASPTMPNVRMSLQGESPFGGIIAMSFTLEAAASALPPEATQRIELWNFDVNAFEIIDERAATLDDRSVTVKIAGDPNRFIGGSAITLGQIQWFGPGAVLSAAWRVTVDQAIWSVSP